MKTGKIDDHEGNSRIRSNCYASYSVSSSIRKVLAWHHCQAPAPPTAVHRKMDSRPPLSPPYHALLTLGIPAQNTSGSRRKSTYSCLRTTFHTGGEGGGLARKYAMVGEKSLNRLEVQKTWNFYVLRTLSLSLFPLGGGREGDRRRKNAWLFRRGVQGGDLL